MVFSILVHYSGAHLNGAVVRVQQEFGQRRYLRGAIPAVWAVHQYGPLVAVHGVNNEERRLEQER